MSAPRLSEATKLKILTAYGAGEKIANIARCFGVHQSYPGLLFRRRFGIKALRRLRNIRRAN